MPSNIARLGNSHHVDVDLTSLILFYLILIGLKAIVCKNCERVSEREIVHVTVVNEMKNIVLILSIYVTIDVFFSITRCMLISLCE